MSAPLTRRKALGLMAAVSIPPTAVVAAAPLVDQELPIDKARPPETPHERLRRLSNEIADILDNLGDPRVEYITIHAAVRNGKAAVFTSFEIPMGDEA